MSNLNYRGSDTFRACEMARQLYPGPVGELIEQELRAWDEFAHRFGGGGDRGDLMHRLVRDLLLDVSGLHPTRRRR